MSEPQLLPTHNRYLPTRENFILRVKELLYELALQASTLREQMRQEDTSSPDNQKPFVMQD